MNSIRLNQLLARRASRKIVSALAFSALFVSHALSAQILIGHTSGITGPVAAGVKEMREGANLYIDAVNNEGGIRGQKISMIDVDDEFKPEKTLKNANVLVKEKGVVALMLTRGTPHNELLMKNSEDLRVPIVGPSTGAMSLHEPVNRWVFNVRPTYRVEAQRAVSLLNDMGAGAVGIVHVDDSFGADVLVGLKNGFTAANLKPVFQLKFDRAKPDFSQILPEIVRQKPNSVIVAGSSQSVVDLVKLARDAGVKASFVTLSNNASNGFIKSLGENAHGVIVSQVYPSDENNRYPIVKEANILARAKGMSAVSPAQMEGFAAAKVLVAGLRATRGKITADTLREGLESLKQFDAGGLELSFSATDHTGFEYVDLSMISKSGKFRR